MEMLLRMVLKQPQYAFSGITSLLQHRWEYIQWVTDHPDGTFPHYMTPYPHPSHLQSLGWDNYRTKSAVWLLWKCKIDAKKGNFSEVAIKFTMDQYQAMEQAKQVVLLLNIFPCYHKTALGDQEFLTMWFSDIRRDIQTWQENMMGVSTINRLLRSTCWNER